MSRNGHMYKYDWKLILNGEIGVLMAIVFLESELATLIVVKNK